MDIDREDVAAIQLLVRNVAAQARGAVAICEWGTPDAVKESVRSDLHSILGYCDRVLRATQTGSKAP